MKIILNSLEDVAALAAVLNLDALAHATGVRTSPAVEARYVVTGPVGPIADQLARAGSPSYKLDDTIASAYLDELAGTAANHMADVLAPIVGVKHAEAATGGTVGVEQAPETEVDSNGLPWNERIHAKTADPAKRKNADGSWRKRKGVDEATVAEVTAELRGQQRAADDAASDEPEGVATETHALPSDADTGVHAGSAIPSHELAVAAGDTTWLVNLVEAAQVIADETSDSKVDLLKAGGAFITAHGTEQFNALKALVAPIEGSTAGKAVPSFTPSECRWLRACLDLAAQAE